MPVMFDTAIVVFDTAIVVFDTVIVVFDTAIVASHICHTMTIRLLSHVARIHEKFSQFGLPTTLLVMHRLSSVIILVPCISQNNIHD